jgi:hypothetical protein
MSLFGANRLHVAILTDFGSSHEKVEDLRRWKILRNGHIFALGSYAGQPGADVEEMLGAGLYVEIVNACYGLKGKQALTAPPLRLRIVTHAGKHYTFRLLHRASIRNHQEAVWPGFKGHSYPL